MLDIKNIILILIVALPMKLWGADDKSNDNMDIEAGQISGVEKPDDGDDIDDEDLMDVPKKEILQTPQVDKAEDKKVPTKPYTPRITGRDFAKACEKSIRKMRGGLATRGSGMCYRGVKFCLKNAGLYDKKYLNEYVGSPFINGDGTKCSSYRQMESAKCAHAPLMNIGMKKLDIKSAKLAPVGSILVYGGGPHGHIEIVGEDANGQKKYYSDFMSSRPISDYSSERKLIGVYVP